MAWEPTQSGLRNKIYVGYRDLSGGLNTKRDSHALDRNQLQLSQNCFYQTGNALSKRPGSANIASGATGSAAACQGMTVSRFANVSTMLVQTNTTNLRFAKVTDANFTNITTAMGASATPIWSAQMLDPLNGGAGGTTTLFITNGVDVPWMWNGPGNTTMTHVATGAGKLPTKFDGVTAITPKFCSTLLGQIFYAGEPTEPNAIYISDPYQPENFSSSAILTSGIYQGSYAPYVAGRNDGAMGGDITGIVPMSSGSMMVYEQSAIYRLDFGFRVYGDTTWQLVPVSVSVGCMSPRSITRFDDFHAFLGVDGVYTTNGFQVQRISDNVPTFFDGPNAMIVDRTTAVGVRYGKKYLLYYDDGSDNAGLPSGHTTRGMWFDFSKPDSDGLPTTGEILGMKVGGVAELRGPSDTGTFAWCNATADQVGQFGTTSSDFGNAIRATFQGKSDWFAEFFDSGAPLQIKCVDNVTLYVSIPQATSAPLVFTVQLIEDFFQGPSTTATTGPPPGGLGGVVGTAIVGTSTVGAPTGVNNYQIAKASIPGLTPGNAACGRVLSVNVSESSVFGWTMLGYELLVNPQRVAR